MIDSAVQERNTHVYQGHKVIDVHGHLSTPPEFMAYAVQLLHLRRFEEKIAPYTDEHGGFSISDEKLEVPLKAHLEAMDARQIDVQLLTPRPVSMWHWELPDVQSRGAGHGQQRHRAHRELRPGPFHRHGAATPECTGRHP